MSETIKVNEKVTVITIYDNIRGSVMPVKMKWRGQVYRINTLDYHNKFWEGRTRIHVYSVANETMYFKLKLDSETLHWTLEEVYDAAGT
jgi:hypothetical protein